MPEDELEVDLLAVAREIAAVAVSVPAEGGAPEEVEEERDSFQPRDVRR